MRENNKIIQCNQRNSLKKVFNNIIKYGSFTVKELNGCDWRKFKSFYNFYNKYFNQHEGYHIYNRKYFYEGYVQYVPEDFFENQGKYNYDQEQEVEVRRHFKLYYEIDDDIDNEQSRFELYFQDIRVLLYDDVEPISSNFDLDQIVDVDEQNECNIIDELDNYTQECKICQVIGFKVHQYLQTIETLKQQLYVFWKNKNGTQYRKEIIFEILGLLGSNYHDRDIFKDVNTKVNLENEYLVKFLKKQEIQSRCSKDKMDKEQQNRKQNMEINRQQFTDKFKKKIKIE